MAEKLKNVKPPRGLARLGWRAPIWFYRLGLSGLLGERFLLLNHIGRKSGKLRQAVLEVVHYDHGTGTYVVASGFGEKADWYQNLLAHPNVMIQVKHKRMNVRAERLPQPQAVEILLEYNRLHPTALRSLAWILGYRTDGSTDDVRFFAGVIPIVALKPPQKEIPG
ncbi:MAG: nitroreductase family deazaflavin-dependent oxidoreductase [Anaerolineales bacterium]|jgi:deazaflavin-dependent oxidoreductase (nitroreductase family)|nr:nitroreductase family deazaflavin-dependent oxidoreductase [Anaerolineales bacterium]